MRARPCSVFENLLSSGYTIAYYVTLNDRKIDDFSFSSETVASIAYRVWKHLNGCYFSPPAQCDQKNRQMSIKVAQNDLTRKMINFDTFTKMPKTMGDLGKLIVAKGFKKFPKVQ